MCYLQSIYTYEHERSEKKTIQKNQSKMRRTHYLSKTSYVMSFFLNGGIEPCSPCAGSVASRHILVSAHTRGQDGVPEAQDEASRDTKSVDERSSPCVFFKRNGDDSEVSGTRRTLPRTTLRSFRCCICRSIYMRQYPSIEEFSRQVQEQHKRLPPTARLRRRKDKEQG